MNRRQPVALHQPPHVAHAPELEHAPHHVVCVTYQIDTPRAAVPEERTHARRRTSRLHACAFTASFGCGIFTAPFRYGQFAVLPAPFATAPAVEAFLPSLR